MMQEFVQSVQNMIKGYTDDIHTAIPGKIVSYNPTNGLATVLPQMKYIKQDNSTIAYPQISGVPVLFPQSGGQKYTIAYPIKADDGCLLIVAEKSLDFWMYGIETQSKLSHDLTNAIAIVGLFSTANEIMYKACEDNAVVIAAGENLISISEDSISINGNVKIDGDVKVTGTVTPNSV